MNITMEDVNALYRQSGEILREGWRHGRDASGEWTPDAQKLIQQAERTMLAAGALEAMVLGDPG